MDGDTVTDVNIEDLLDGAVELLRAHRRAMAAWLALEVLQFEPVAQEDEELVDRLLACQERLRAKTAARRSRWHLTSDEHPQKL